jgi:undecaprenyl diphosphate synthase
MELPTFSRLPKHVAIIPDGNRRWAQQRGLGKEAGYAFGIGPALELLELCIALGIEEVTSYGFTFDNARRPTEQREAFAQACVDAVGACRERNVSLLVVGNTDSTVFPQALLPYTTRQSSPDDVIRGNFLVNYDWHWDLAQTALAPAGRTRRSFMEGLGSAEISRVDLLVRWGGRRRLSGMLPVQTVYSDIYVVDDLWPDFTPAHFFDALRWYEQQDVTLGG